VVSLVLNFSSRPKFSTTSRFADIRSQSKLLVLNYSFILWFQQRMITQPCMQTDGQRNSEAVCSFEHLISGRDCVKWATQLTSRHATRCQVGRDWLSR